jgi:DNA-binding LacI/PurR family transcriptional regulator
MPDTARATIRDVARVAGVSPATVSFATQERVRSAVAELGYTPHRIARALREGRSRLVLLKTGAFRGGSVLDAMIEGMDAELRLHGHTLIVAYGDAGADAEFLQAVAPHTVMDLGDVYFSRDEVHDDGGWVDGLASHTATQLRHLISRGHTRIGIAVTTAPHLSRLSSIRLRHAAEFADSHGLDPLPALWLGDDVDEAETSLAAFRAEHPEVTAIAALDDDVALLVLAGASRLGIRVPTDLAVIGFGESSHARLWVPPLTSVRIDAAAFGRRAARRALGLDVAEWQTPPSEVIPRATV